MGRFRYLLYIAAAVGLYALWTLAVFPMAADHTPACAICHTPRQAYTSTYGSAHEDIGCLACHRSPGVAGAVASDFRGWTNLTSWVFRRPPRDFRVDNDSCLACHDVILDGVTQSKELKMSHREVIDTGWRCAECHGETGHSLAPGKSVLQTASMDRCFGCHIASKSLGRCRLCHRRDVTKEKPDDPKTLGPIAHTTGWTDRHGTADDGQCPICHQGSFCRDCHGIDLPHPSNSWPEDHGEVALNDGRTCRRCHAKDFCSNCHAGVVMPHAGDYLTGHMKTVKRPSVCENCHIRKECLACHDSHTKHRARRRAKDERGT